METISAEDKNTNRNSSDTDGKAKCKTCGEEYRKPLLAVIVSGNELKEYNGCPNCLSKVNGKIRIRTCEIKEDEDKTNTKQIKVEEAIQTEKNKNCQHEIGYLKQRSKDTPIPEECFVCSKMIECVS